MSTKPSKIDDLSENYFKKNLGVSSEKHELVAPNSADAANNDSMTLTATAPDPSSRRRPRAKPKANDKEQPTKPNARKKVKHVPNVPNTRKDGAMHHAKLRHPVSIDTNWSASTWLNKSSKGDMLYVLESAGEDIIDVKDLQGELLTHHMVAVRGRREAERKANLAARAPSGQNQAQDQNNPWELAMALAMDAEDDAGGSTSDPETAFGKDESTLIGEEGFEQDTEEEGTTLAKEDTMLVDSDIALITNDTTLSEGENQEEFTWNIRPLPKKAHQHEHRKAWAASLRKFPLTMSEVDDFKSGCKYPTMSVQTVRSYLLAIKRRANLDARFTAFGDHESIVMSDADASDTFIPSFRDTIIRDADGNTLFSYHVQMLIRNILKPRETLRLWGDRARFVGGRKVLELISAETAHSSLCGHLIELLADYLEDWEVDGQVEAAKLIEELFGV